MAGTPEANIARMIALGEASRAILKGDSETIAGSGRFVQVADRHNARFRAIGIRGAHPSPGVIVRRPRRTALAMGGEMSFGYCDDSESFHLAFFHLRSRQPALVPGDGCAPPCHAQTNFD